MEIQKKANKIPRRIPPKRMEFHKSTLILCAGVACIALLSIIIYFLYLIASLPKIDRLADYKPPIVSQVFGDDGSLVGEFYLERRTVVPVEKIPKKLIQAFVAAEDANFYQHRGIDYLGIVRAAFKNLVSLSKKEGASTITQQVARSMLLTPKKEYSRKLKEAIIATRMEKALTKDEILYIYLNQIYMGSGAYGVQLAAETYFGKDVEQLDLAEMAMLAGLPKAPTLYSPIKHLDRAKQRQAYVLERMVKEGYITQAEADHAASTPIVIRSKKKVNSDQSAYFLEQVRIQLEEKYGEDQLYKEGLKIYTTMNAEMQMAAYDGVVNGLKSLDKRQGYRGPLKYLAENEIEDFCKKVEDGIDEFSLKAGSTYQGVITGMDAAKRELTVQVGERKGTIPRKNMSWAGKVRLVDSYDRPADDKGKAITLGSVIEVSVTTPDVNKTGAIFALDQEPLVQAALFAMDPKSGAVKAMVGGYDFKKSQFNRAMQARRNAGSAFKPIIYAAAIDKGMTPASIIDDSPIEFPGSEGKVWAPRNYDNIYRGPVTMREALTNSINVVSVKILENIGVGYALEYAKKLGITSPLADNLTLALGSSSVTPMELTSAYAVFASGGYRLTPFFIIKVTDRDGRVLEEITPPQVPVFSSMTSAVKSTGTEDEPGQGPETDVRKPSEIQEKVALTPVRVLSVETSFIMTNLMESVVSRGTGQRALAVGRPVAGKTGTTNDMKDAWFVGFVPQLVAGVWVGYDQERSLGASGSGGQAAAPIWTDFMKRAVTGKPVIDFTAPPNINFALINPLTGKLARAGTDGSVMECFIAGTEPSVYDGDSARPAGPYNPLTPGTR